jgi:YVTN family beta-propeller protein
VYWQGRSRAAPLVAGEIVRLLKSADVPIRAGGKTRFNETIVQGLIGPDGVGQLFNDGSIDELLAAPTVIAEGRRRRGPGAPTAIVVETPAYSGSRLGDRVAGHRAVIRAVQALWQLNGGARAADREFAGGGEAAVVPAAAAYRVYVTNETSGDLTVIDGTTNTAIGSIPLGKRPRGIQDARDGRHLYVALSGSPVAAPGAEESGLPPPDRGADGIGVVDLAEGKVTRILRGISDPEQLAVSRDGTRLYVASEDAGEMLVLEARSGSVLTTLKVGGEPEGIAVRPDGRELYVTSEQDHSVAVVDLAPDRVAAMIGVGSRPRGIVFNSAGTRAYVTNENDASISVIDTAARRVVHTIRLAGENVRWAPSPRRMASACSSPPDAAGPWSQLMREQTPRWDRSRWGRVPGASLSVRTGNLSIPRMAPPTMSRSWMR